MLNRPDESGSVAADETGISWWVTAESASMGIRQAPGAERLSITGITAGRR